MPAEVIMPALGMAQDTGTVLRWLKRDGDAVAEGEPLAEIETDKATVEIEAPASGTLASVRAAEGTEVTVGTVIAIVLAPGESAHEVPEPLAGGKPVVGEQRPRAEPAPLEGKAPVGGQPVGAGPPARERRPRVSPKARRLAQARGVDLAGLSGTGPRGAVVAADVERALQAIATGHEQASRRAAAEQFSPRGPATADGDRFELTTVWRVMAERTQRSWQEVPQFVLWRDVDAARLESWRAAARRKQGCEEITHTDLLVRVCAEALRRHPRVNASWHAGTVVPGAGINVAVAVATDDGLVAPVVHHADELDLATISARRRQLTEAARLRQLRPDDLQGATFTISNLGMYGVDGFQAIVDAPQAAILAVGRVSERPAVRAGDLLVRPMLTLSVSFDHRVVDGARGAQFLDTLASLVEEPAALVV